MIRHHHRPLLKTLLSLLLVGLLLAPATRISAQSERCFPATGFCIDGRFRVFWERNGGLAIFGYPITAPLDEPANETSQRYLTQWFERARFELHPEHAGTPYEVQLSLLGRQVTRGREDERPFQPIGPVPVTPSRQYFPQTGHSLAGAFEMFWDAHPGLAIFGYPISEEFQEQNASDGKIYTVQYFERARFEYHPEDRANVVALGLLGSQIQRPVPLPEVVAIKVAAGAVRETVPPNRTILLPAGADDIVVTMRFPQPIDPQAIRATVVQAVIPARWQLETLNPSAADEYGFRLRGGPDSASYVRIDVTRGANLPAVHFGIQLGNNLPSLPALVADWTDPLKLLESYYNAIDRKEYLRPIVIGRVPAPAQPRPHRITRRSCRATRTLGGFY
jgi:hypothetical protein